VQCDSTHFLSLSALLCTAKRRYRPREIATFHDEHAVSHVDQCCFLPDRIKSRIDEHQLLRLRTTPFAEGQIGVLRTL
jgi:hypothetical protein